MPVLQCKLDGKPGFKFGEGGKCFTYTAGDEAGRKGAKQKATNQGLAIGESEDELEATHERGRDEDKDKFSDGMLTGVEIFATGTWNGFKFVEEDLVEIVENTKKLMTRQRHEAPLKLGHSKKQILAQSDGQPALGWIENVAVQGNKIIANFKNVPSVLKKAISKGLWKKISVELNHIQHVGWIISGAALLGADLPGVKTLEDVNVFLSEALDEGVMGLTFSEPVIIKEDDMEDTKIALREKELTLKFEEEKRQLQVKLTELEGKAAGMEELKLTVAFKEAKEGILSSFKAEVKDGKLQPWALKELEAALDSQKINFTEGTELSVPVTFLAKISKAYTENLPTSEQAGVDASGGTDIARADEVVAKKILECMENTGKGYMDASELVFNANPDLQKQYAAFGNEIIEKGYDIYN